MNTFPLYWTFVRGIHRLLVISPHKGQWRGVLISYLICTWTKSWVNNRGADDLRHYRSQYEVTVMLQRFWAHNHGACSGCKAQKSRLTNTQILFFISLFYILDCPEIATRLRVYYYLRDSTTSVFAAKSTRLKNRTYLEVLSHLNTFSEIK